MSPRGNGQAAEALAPHFKSVHATDASAKQIAEARPIANIRYAVEPADLCSLKNNSADLVTVAQALHWFAHDNFYAEVKRVLKPGGIFAAWGVWPAQYRTCHRRHRDKILCLHCGQVLAT